MTDQPILRVEGLTVRFGGLTALNQVQLAVPRGENPGDHRSERSREEHLLQLPDGRAPAHGGTDLFDGEDVTGLSPDAISKKAMARSYQITNILPGASVLENVRIAAQSRRHGWNLVRHHRAFTDVLDRTRAVLAAVGLGEKEDELAANLSHGEQRNLEIGVALATEPKLLCLDEPTAGMSVAETHATVELIRRIARDLTILIVEHDMEVVMGLAHTITVLHYGEVLAEGAPADIQADARVQEVYLKA